LVSEAQRQTVLGYFETRFGIPLSTFDTFRLLERRKTYVLLNRTAPIAAFASLKVQNVGLPVLRKMPHHLKPTTAALQRFGALARQHILELSPQQTVALLRQQELALHTVLTPGYVVLRCEGNILGCGLYTPGRLRSQIPLRQVKHQRLPESP
jgi:NOL1/NOP2/fmu family ribosome biogenesis protein